jgi:hypothetical protein
MQKKWVALLIRFLKDTELQLIGISFSYENSTRILAKMRHTTVIKSVFAA